MADSRGRVRKGAEPPTERRVLAAPDSRPSQYANHVAVLAAGRGEPGEVTFMFYQISAGDLASQAAEVTALPLGSIVMQRGFAEDFVRDAARTLGVSLGAEEKTGAAS